MELATFNVNDGFTEALIRGYRSALLTSDDYRKLSLAESLEDVRACLEETDYGVFLMDEPSPLSVQAITNKCRDKFMSEFNNISSQTSGKFLEFLNILRLEKMIDNVTLLIQSTLSNKPIAELLPRLDPLGWCDEMRVIPTMDFSAGFEEVFRVIIVDTPIREYFAEFMEYYNGSASHQNDGGAGGSSASGGVGHIRTALTETDVEIMRNFLRKCWLESLHAFCDKLGGTTALVMCHLLSVEADFRSIAITLNSLNSPLGTPQRIQDRNSLLPCIGYLYPEGVSKLYKAWNDQTIRAALEPYERYAILYDQCKGFYESSVVAATSAGGPASSAASTGAGSVARNYKSIEDLLYAELEKVYEDAFENQFHYGIAYAWVKLAQQELRNIEWICNMVTMSKGRAASGGPSGAPGAKDSQSKAVLDHIIPIFSRRV